MPPALERFTRWYASACRFRAWHDHTMSSVQIVQIARLSLCTLHPLPGPAREPSLADRMKTILADDSGYQWNRPRTNLADTTFAILVTPSGRMRDYSTTRVPCKLLGFHPSSHALCTAGADPTSGSASLRLEMQWAAPACRRQTQRHGSS